MASEGGAEGRPSEVGPEPHSTVDSPGVLVALLAVGVVGISFSGPIVVALTIPALAVAFWRNAFGALVMAPIAAVSGRAEWRRLVTSDRRSFTTALVAGVALTVHFALWVPSLRMTSVAASTALVTTTPVWTVVIDRLRGRPVRSAVLFGVGLAMVGTLAITGVDAGRSGRALVGDLLALLGGMAGAAYITAGESARQRMSTSAYTAVAYSTCALGLLVVCLVGRQPLGGTGYDARAWLLLGLLTVCAQLMGHTLFNRVVAVVGATTVSLVILLETPGAAVVAWIWLGQRPPALVVPGALLVLAGIALVVASRRVTNVTVTEALPPG